MPNLDRHELSQSLRRLGKRLLQTAGEHDRTAVAPIRIEVETSLSDPLTWIQALEAERKIYWRDRERRFELAGVGQAHTIELSVDTGLGCLDQLSDRLKGTNGALKYVGGLRFDPLSATGAQDSPWSSFGTGWLTLPRVTLTVDSAGSALACHLMPHETDGNTVKRIADYVVGLHIRAANGDPASGIVGRKDCPDMSGWEESISAILRAISDNRCEKVVPARRTDFILSDVIDPWSVLTRLRDDSDNRTLFGLQSSKGATFLGATPERLFYRRGVRLESEAIAGTRRRGVTPEIDAVIERELLDSAKDRHEHNFVVNSLRAHLGTVCEHLQVSPEPEIVKLINVQHLKTRLDGTLRGGVGDGRLLSLIHPTPAVNGYPRAAAMSLLREIEPFDRGWYAGPLGWIGADEAEFVVGIRSALIAGDRAHAYAGAGVVPGSVPEEEWAELETKIAPIVSALCEVR